MNVKCEDPVDRRTSFSFYSYIFILVCMKEKPGHQPHQNHDFIVIIVWDAARTGKASLDSVRISGSHMVPLDSTEARLSKLEKIGQENCQLEIFYQEVSKRLGLMSLGSVLSLTSPDLFFFF